MGFFSFLGVLLVNYWTLAAMAAAVAFRFWNKSTIGVCTSTRRLEGRTALVTGANTGIGLETARDLAQRGARVLLACRDPERGQKALENVSSVASKGASVALLSLDLESLKSVRACADRVLATEPRLDILINNAGAGNLGSEMTKDGLHRGLQVNHFGPFLFTLLLTDLLKKSAPSRVVFVASVMHEIATLRPEMLDYNRAKKIDEVQIYAMSKLCNILVSNEFARRLRDSGVTVNSVHPGVVATDIYRSLPLGLGEVARSLSSVFFKNVEEGAQTTIYAAVSEEVEGMTGCYFSDCKEKRMALPAYDEDLTRAVWKKSEELVQMQGKIWESFSVQL